MRRTLTLDQLPEEPRPGHIMCLERASLERLTFDRLRWRCQIKGCTSGTHVRDYGIAPWYFLDRNSKMSHQHPHRYWHDLRTQFWLCGAHRKRFIAAERRYGWAHVAEHMLDPLTIERKIEKP